MYLGWITEWKKNGFVDTHWLWHFETTIDTDISETGRSALFHLSLVQIIWSKVHNRKGVCWFYHRRAKFDSQQGFWKERKKIQLICRAPEVRVCTRNICTKNTDTNWNCVKGSRVTFHFYFSSLILNFAFMHFLTLSLSVFFLALSVFLPLPLFFCLHHLAACRWWMGQFGKALVDHNMLVQVMWHGIS